MVDGFKDSKDAIFDEIWNSLNFHKYTELRYLIDNDLIDLNSLNSGFVSFRGAGYASPVDSEKLNELIGAINTYDASDISGTFTGWKGVDF